MLAVFKCPPRVAGRRYGTPLLYAQQRALCPGRKGPSEMWIGPQKGDGFHGCQKCPGPLSDAPIALTTDASDYAMGAGYEKWISAGSFQQTAP